MASKLRSLLAFLAVSSSAGALLALVALPFAASAGLGVQSGIDYWDGLPSELLEPPLPQGSTIYAADGKTSLGTLYLYNRQVVALEQVAPVMAKAIVDIEDSRFYTNGGVDYRAMARALKSNSSSDGVQGGSTLTQQYVKNTLLLAAQTSDDALGAKSATERSLERKLREAKLAIGVDKKYTKAQILAKYLNIAYFGDGAYGIEAAALRYFGVHALELNLPQAATLAGLVQNPAGYSPISRPTSALERRDVVLNRMAALATITTEERDVAKAQPLGLHVTSPAQGCASGPYPFYCDWVTSVLMADPSMGATETARKARLLSGGLHVKTALEPAVQAKAQAAVDAVMPHDDRVAAVDVVVQPGTGHVQAIAVNRDYGTGPGQSVYPLATTASAQVGSTFKAFTLAAALEAGIPLNTVLPGGDHYTSDVFDNPASGSYSNDADGFGSNLSITDAVAKSVNTAFVQLEEKVGVLAVADTARRAGVTSLPVSGPHPVTAREGTLTLGAREVSPVDMANAYATFGAHGLACPAVAVTAVSDLAGIPVPGPATACHQAISTAVADSVTSVLTSVLAPGGTGVAQVLDRPAAGKTGTTENEAAAWFVGFTPQASTAVWLGDPRGGQTYPLHNVHGIARVFGGTLPGAIWKRSMTSVLDGVPVVDLPGVNLAYLDVASGPLVPSVLGMDGVAAAGRLVSLGVQVATTVAPVGSLPAPAKAGVVVAMSPPAGVPVPAAGTITLTLSP